jgi:hypothetical protein
MTFSLCRHQDRSERTSRIGIEASQS